MKYGIIIASFLLLTPSSYAQRPSTKAEHDEDARVLQIISSSMPKDIAEAPDPDERSNNGIGGNSSDLSGISGFHNNMNFATRNTFEHYYKADYNFKKIPDELAAELNPIINQAKDKTDVASLEAIYKISNCTIIVSVNQFNEGNEIHSFYPIAAFKSPYSNVAFRDNKGYETILFFGACKPVLSSEDGEGPDGKPGKTYRVEDKAKLQIGTVIQTIAISIDAHPAIAAYMLKHMNVEKIKALLGTGKFSDDVTESELKKYFAEKPVKPVVPGMNGISFTYVDEAGREQQFSLQGAPRPIPSGGGIHDCSVLENHNENAKVLENAELRIDLADKKYEFIVNITVPIVRTTGEVTATYQSDHDYLVMWSANLVNSNKEHLILFPDEIHIKVTKWAPVGDFIEGTFYGTATSSDPKDPNGSPNTALKYTIKNGKFKMRRIEDIIQTPGLQ
ncbi:MAG: hypothetical protein JST86_07085 [Bacteroidetes bacterium]|nr:hypothetical protein [Bacteroidota bacterium]